MPFDKLNKAQRAREEAHTRRNVAQGTKNQSKADFLQGYIMTIAIVNSCLQTNTRKGAFIGGLLLSGAALAAAKSASSANPDNTDVKVVRVEQVNQQVQHNIGSYGVLLDSLDSLKRPLNVTHTRGAREKLKEKLNATKSKTQELVGKSESNNIAAACKYEALKETEGFNVCLSTSQEMHAQDRNAEFIYDGNSYTILLNIDLFFDGMDDDNRNQIIIEHELHHAWIAFRNFNAKIGYQTKFNVEDGLVANGKEHDAFAMTLINGFTRIDQLLQLFNSKNLSQSQKNVLNDVRDAAKDYKPYLFKTKVDTDTLAKWQAEGVVDKDYNLLKPGYLHTRSFSITVGHERKYQTQYKLMRIDTSSGAPYVYYYNADKSELAKIAVLDVAVKVETAIRSYPQKLLLSEADAFIHETLERHPKLFKLLFKEMVLDYHAKRNPDSYNACLERKNKTPW